MSHLSPLQTVAAGLRALPEVSRPFAATQAAWRFYANPEVSLPRLGKALVEAAREGVELSCKHHALIVLDWSNLHFGKHRSKTDRVDLSSRFDLGYELLTALVVSDFNGAPVAPVCLELRSSAGVYSTREQTPLQPLSQLDGLGPVMAHVDALSLGRPLVYVIDREADSVGHYRQWSQAGRTFLVRADDSRLVLFKDQELQLIEVAKILASQERLKPGREVEVKGVPGRQFVGETQVVLHRPARLHRVTGKGKNRKKKHINVPGEPLTLRLIVSEIRDENGKVLARWLLLTNACDKIACTTLALWYYWRWRIESYHKLLKSAGMQVEQWLQDDAETISKRLLVSAMAGVVVWTLARDQSPEAERMREMLVRLSGRQMKRGKGHSKFTEPALLAGLGVLLPMLHLLETHTLEEIRKLARATLPPTLLPPALANDQDTG